MQAKKENAEFVELVERNKVEKHINERKKRKDNPSITDTTITVTPTTTTGNNSIAGKETNMIKKPRIFHQNKLISQRHGDDIHTIDKSILHNIMTNKKS